MINVTAAIGVREDRAAEFEAVIAAARPGMLAGPGCLRYDLQRVSGSRTDYVLLEAYADGDAIRRHGESDEFSALGAALADLVTGAPVITVLKPVGEQAT